jgi:hypothetical protein
MSIWERHSEPHFSPGKAGLGGDAGLAELAEQVRFLLLERCCALSSRRPGWKDFQVLHAKAAPLDA